MKREIIKNIFEDPVAFDGQNRHTRRLGKKHPRQQGVRLYRSERRQLLQGRAGRV